MFPGLETPYALLPANDQVTTLPLADSAFLDGMENHRSSFRPSSSHADAKFHYRLLFWLTSVALSARHLQESTSQQDL